MRRALAAVSVGDALPERARTVTREDVLDYAAASGDDNPLHRDDDVARAAGFPGVIAHGMFTMGHLVSALVEWAGDTSALASIRVGFRAPVLLGETIVAGGSVVALDEERATVTLEVWVRVDRDGATEWPIRRSRAEVRLAP